MGAATQALYFLLHPNQLRNIIQWYALAHPTLSPLFLANCPCCLQEALA